MSILNNPEFKSRLKSALVYASDFIETDAEFFRECTTDQDGHWIDPEDEREYQAEMQKVAEMTELLRMIHEDGNEQ